MDVAVNLIRAARMGVGEWIHYSSSINDRPVWWCYICVCSISGYPEVQEHFREMHPEWVAIEVLGAR